MNRDEIIIRQAVMHILDSSVGMPVLSEELLELSPDLCDFIRGLIFKIAAGDDLKHGVFDTSLPEEKQMVFRLLQNFDESEMIPFSQRISEYLYEIMNRNMEIPPADFLIATYQQGGGKFLALLKLNYKETFVHLTASNESGGNTNDIIKQTKTLPGQNAKLSEAVLIDLQDFSVNIVEKKYEINGEKINYLSELFLGCHALMSQKTKMNIVTKAVEQIHEKYFPDEYDRKMEAKSIIQSEIEEKGTIEVSAVAEKIYGEVPEIREEFTEKMEKYHMENAVIEPQNEGTTKKLQKQFLTTDTGIEINIPMEMYKDTDKVEFITNPDGTISILIRNISRIMTK